MAPQTVALPQSHESGETPVIPPMEKKEKSEAAITEREGGHNLEGVCGGNDT